MLNLTRNGSQTSVELGTGVISFDTECGGEIVSLTCKNELESHELVTGNQTAPGLFCVVDGKSESLANVASKLEVVEYIENRSVKLRNTAALANGRLEVVQVYEIFAEGALFCELSLAVKPGATLNLSDLSLNIHLDTDSAKEMRWGHFTRKPWYKQDYSTTHTFFGKDLYKKRDESVSHRELWPLASIDLGWDSVKFFSNRLEFILEEWVSVNEVPLDRTMTSGGCEKDGWGIHWHLHKDETLKLTSPMRYRNKWGIIMGTARTRSGKDADPALRNNALGCRIAHCMYPYARESSEWPWVTMPIKQVDCQPPQFFKGNPDISRVDEAADLGADTMIIHQFWMRNPGTNGEPVADYIVNDPAWFKAFVDRCHERDMRVLPYIRGIEQWHMYATYFEDYLQQDRDGLYPDWNSPHSMGFTKCSPMHWSAYNYFQYTRAMRKRVGDGGVIIGHTGNTFAAAQTCLDVALGGEFSVRHDQLLTEPESAAYFANLSYTGAHLISGNLPDRESFSSRRAMAICAAFGMTGHPFMEPNGSFSGPVEYIKPLWDAMRSVSGSITRIHNPAYSPTNAVACESNNLFPSLWQTSEGEALLLVSNLSKSAINGSVSLSLKELDLAANAKAELLQINGTNSDALSIDGDNVIVQGLPSDSFAAIRISGRGNCA